MKIAQLLWALASWLICAHVLAEPTPSDIKIQLGRMLFNDTSLSRPSGQACVTCHSPEAAFSDPRGTAFSIGAKGQLGIRNTPSIAYANVVPEFTFDNNKKNWLGGLLWDGNANSLAEQASTPLLDPMEMNASAVHVLMVIKQKHYASLFSDAYGKRVLANSEAALEAVSDALAAFQSSEQFAPRFTSKFDAWKAQKVEFTELEQRGNFVFQDSGLCLNCHKAFNDFKPVLFTDWTFHNLGVPANPDAPIDHQQDTGLAINKNIRAEQKLAAKGAFRTPSLRNVAITAPYMHNGVFKTLREVVDFYNSRDVSDRWAEPEFKENINTEDMGDLKLSERDIDALVAFMETLTDGYEIPAPSKETLKTRK